MKLPDVRNSVIVLVVVAAVLANYGCSPRTPAGPIGEVKMAIDLSMGVTLNSVAYKVTGNGIQAITGNIDVTTSLHPEVLLEGLPVGDGYAVAMDAMATDGKTTCHGTGMFSVASGQTAMVNVILLCRNEVGTTVDLGGRLDNCPFVSGGMTTATTMPVGATATISAYVTDFDKNDTVTYMWTVNPAAVGIFGDPTLVATTFKCNTAGVAALNMAVSDGACGQQRNGVLAITCTRPVTHPDAGAGGVGGAGGPGGIGGQDAGATSDAAASYHCPGLEPGTRTTACGTCTNDPGNCGMDLSTNGSDGCCNLSAAADQVLCAAAVECFTMHAADCTSSGDPVKCFCGSSGGQCFMTAGAANGPCTAEVLAAAKTTSPSAIQGLFTNGASPLGHAVNLVSCRGTFCSDECGIP